MLYKLFKKFIPTVSDALPSESKQSLQAAIRRQANLTPSQRNAERGRVFINDQQRETPANQTGDESSRFTRGWYNYETQDIVDQQLDSKE